MPRQVLLFGSLIPPALVSKTPEASEAGNLFQHGLLRGLLRCGVDNALVLTAPAIRAVPPRKVFLPRRSWHLGDSLDVLAPPFLNVPPIKPLSVHMSLKRAALAGGHADTSAVLAYNPQPGRASAGLAVARKLGVPFVCIVADFPPEGRSRSPLRVIEQAWRQRIMRASDGLVVLSGHTVRDFELKQPWIKIDGGLAEDWEVLPDVPLMHKTVVFAGTPSHRAGTRLMLGAFSRLADPEMRLIFAGRRGLEDEVRSAAAVDPRITVEGFLPRPDLQRLLASSTVLVNLRLSSEPENRYNFPSKLLDFLASGRPVVTTLAGDLDPAFHEVTVPLVEETPSALAAVLQQVCSRPEPQLASLGAAGRKFVTEHRSWDSQSRAVFAFLERIAEERNHEVAPVSRTGRLR